ncbi:DUF3347 domain-containing protein [Cytophaga aurantiaca]|uniref:DUF3347 domain-containing protein n=1 Tax=Cytophaga aurantiaca TaxID=29530 RepID=UPI00036B490B|nr:DUF3347 domain-containing protein [Cytophaga aurantiaca]
MAHKKIKYSIIKRRKMKKVILSITIATMILTIACNENKEKVSAELNEETHDHASHDHENTAKTEDRVIEASDMKNPASTEIINAYLQIKNALVTDNKDGAAKEATALLTAFSNFDMTQLTGSQHKEYMEIIDDAKGHAEHIIKSPIDHQREHFEGLSIDINDLIALVGTDKQLYQDFCPMANGGKGAIWLSEIKDIENPFFGNKMLKCGSVQKQIN